MKNNQIEEELLRLGFTIEGRECPEWCFSKGKLVVQSTIERAPIEIISMLLIWSNLEGSKVGILKEIIKAQKQYIDFLEKECSRVTTFLYVHNMSCGEEIAKEGQRLRDGIDRLQNN